MCAAARSSDRPRAPPRCCARPRRTGRARSARRRAGCGTTSRRRSASRTAPASRAVRLAADPAGEADQAEHAGRRREGHGVARPALRVLADRRQRRLALAGQDLVEDRDVALLARRRAGRQLERPRARRLGLVAAAQQLLGAGERDVGEREALVGGDRLGERCIGAGGGGHQAVDAAPIGIARRRRSSCSARCRSDPSTSCLLLAGRRVPHRRGHRLREVGEHQVERDADALGLRRRWPARCASPRPGRSAAGLPCSARRRRWR